MQHGHRAWPLRANSGNQRQPRCRVERSQAYHMHQENSAEAGSHTHAQDYIEQACNALHWSGPAHSHWYFISTSIKIVK